MYMFRLNLRKVSIGILLLGQLFLILLYFFPLSKPNFQTTDSHISFLRSEDYENVIQTYHSLNSNIILKSIKTTQSYMDFNSSLCFINGTDLNLMRLSTGGKWKCECLPGWHGNDCGQPEVLWRAILSSRKPVKIRGPRTFERRLIYVFKVDKFSEYVAEIRVNELGPITDLFILYEDENSNFLLNKLDNKFCQEYQHKILYMQDNGSTLWKKVKPYLKNLRNDDIILSSISNEIPNNDALIFLKFYDHWPQPIKFRYRWSVFGFFWVHPSRTITAGGACTISFLKESFNNELSLLTDNRTLSTPLYRGLVLGDLNHYGGWYCEYCNDPSRIVDFLSAKSKNVINWDEIHHEKIDTNFVEDLIENGVYIDSKIELRKAHKYNDNYFAPKFVLEHDWKYDFLLVNFYSKLDYYDG